MDDIYWERRLKEKDDELNRLSQQIMAQAATIKELNELILAMVEEKKNATQVVQETPPLF